MPVSLSTDLSTYPQSIHRFIHIPRVIHISTNDAQNNPQRVITSLYKGYAQNNAQAAMPLDRVRMHSFIFWL
jgi:hypothetical protein